MRISVVLGTLLVAGASIGAAQQRHLMLVANKGGITLYNADNNEVICKKETETRPHEVAFSPNGRNMYVPIYSNTLLGMHGTNEHALYIFSSRECREINRLDTGIFTRLHGISVTKSNQVYVTAENGKVVMVLDGVNQAIKGVIPTDSDSSHMLVTTPDETLGFVSNVLSKNISVLDLTKKQLAGKIDVGAENQRIDLAPDAKTFVTSLWKEGKLAFFDVEKRAQAFTVPIDGSAIQAKYSADGKFVYAVGAATKEEIGVWKIDVAKKEAVASAKTGIGKSAAGFSINIWTGELYIADQVNDQIVVVNPNDLSVVKKIATEAGPDGIAFANSR